MSRPRKLTDAERRAKHAQDSARWAKANPEKVRATMARWRANNFGYARQASRDRYEQTREAQIAKSTAWTQANRDRRNARRRQLRGENIEKARAAERAQYQKNRIRICANSRRRRAAKKALS